MRRYEKLLWWIVITGGLLWGYEGVTGMQLQQIVLGTSLATVVNVIVGIAAVVLIYVMMTGKKGKR